MSCVVDASVVARWFIGDLDDSDAAAARVVLDGYKKGDLQLHAPELMPIEVANAIWKEVRFAEWSASRAREALTAFLEVQVALHPHRTLVLEGFELAVTHGLSAYDTSYAALAKKLDAPLWTLDRKLARALAGAIDVRIPPTR